MNGDKARSPDPGVNKYLHTRAGKKDATQLKKIARRLIKHSTAYKRLTA